MEIRFVKLPGNRHVIEVRGRQGPDIVRPPRETGPTLPHDLAHAAVEQALGIADGFWGTVARGATFEDFEPLQPSRHRRSGLKTLERRSTNVFPSELLVSWAHRVYSGQRTTGRGLGKIPISAVELERAVAALADAHARWNAVPEGEALVWRF